jgi:hypothetical protein
MEKTDDFIFQKTLFPKNLTLYLRFFKSSPYLTFLNFLVYDSRSKQNEAAALAAAFYQKCRFGSWCLQYCTPSRTG